MNHLGELYSLLKFLRIQPYVNTDSFNSVSLIGEIVTLTCLCILLIWLKILKLESIGRGNDAETARDMQL